MSNTGKMRTNYFASWVYTILVFFTVLEAILGLDKLISGQMFGWIEAEDLKILIVIVYSLEIVALLLSFYVVFPLVGYIPKESRLQRTLAYMFLTVLNILTQYIVILFTLTDGGSPTPFYWLWAFLIPNLVLLDKIASSPGS